MTQEQIDDIFKKGTELGFEYYSDLGGDYFTETKSENVFQLLKGANFVWFIIHSGGDNSIVVKILQSPEDLENLFNAIMP